MPLKRKILFTAYFVLKKSGYLTFKNSSINQAVILAFHRVNDYDSNHLTTSVQMFDKLLQTIQQQYKPIPLEDLINKLIQGKKISPQTIVITFDDGYRDNILYAAPILKKHNISATFFVTSGYIGTQRIFPWDEGSNILHPLMTWEEVRELKLMGFEIGAHTVNHLDLGTISEHQAKKEIWCSKEQIENEINEKIKSIAIPFGKKECIQSNTTQIIKEAGFQSCCMLRGGRVTQDNKLYCLPRVPIYPSYIEQMMELENFLTYQDNNMKIHLPLL